MKKIILITGILTIVLVGFSISRAADTFPPLPIPVVDGSTTADSITPTASPLASPIASPIPTPTPSVKASIVVQTFIDNAQTGPQIYVLLAVSLLGAFGLFCIKKYFDRRKYNL